MPLFPCVACGFLVFSEPLGSYEICSICGWEDDHVQARLPGLPMGANHTSLYDYQRHVVLTRAPVGVELLNGARRTPGWRLLRKDEARAQVGEPATGFAYFQASGAESPAYYWESDVPPAS